VTVRSVRSLDCVYSNGSEVCDKEIEFANCWVCAKGNWTTDRISSVPITQCPGEGTMRKARISLVIAFSAAPTEIHARVRSVIGPKPVAGRTPGFGLWCEWLLPSTPRSSGAMGKWRGHPPSRELGRGSARYPDTSHNGQLRDDTRLLPGSARIKVISAYNLFRVPGFVRLGRARPSIYRIFDLRQSGPAGPTASQVRSPCSAEKEPYMEGSQEMVSKLKKKYPMLYHFTDRPFGVEIEFYGMDYFILPPDNGIIKP